MHPMTNEFFRDREKALEDSFFFKRDKVLLEQLKHDAERDLQKTALGAASGISDDKILEDLLDAGINAKTAASLSIVPLVVVAWADGVIQPQERKAILQGADEAGMTKGDAAYQLLQTWLDEKPEDSLFIAWKEYIQALAKQVNTETLRRLKDNITTRIHKIAKAAGGVLGIHKVDVSEKQAMKEIESAFDVE